MLQNNPVLKSKINSLWNTLWGGVSKLNDDLKDIYDSYEWLKNKTTVS